MNRMISISALVCALFVSVHAADDSNEMPSLEIKRCVLPDQETQIASDDLNRIAVDIKKAAEKGDSAQVKSLRSEAKAHKAVIDKDHVPVKTESVLFYRITDKQIQDLQRDCNNLKAALDSI